MNDKNISIEFHGGAEEVTGACYLLASPEVKILIDCGLFQGSRAMEKKNHEDFKFNPKEIDAVFITHSHIDHIGRLPKLVKDGFTGQIFSTRPTKELATLMLEDALHFMKDPEIALYTKEDIEKTLSMWHSLAYYNPKCGAYFGFGDDRGFCWRKKDSFYRGFWQCTVGTASSARSSSRRH